MTKTVVITGSTSGLGKATALSCLESGANVVISSESAPELERTLAQFAEYSAVVGKICDVTQQSQVFDLLAFALEQFGEIDCWINNAGTSAPSGATASVPIDIGALLVNTNIMGTYFGSVVALRYFRQCKRGRLINITGRGEKSAQPFANLYASSKAWIRNFTLALAREEKSTGIEIASFNPGLILTELTSKPRVLRGNEDRMIKGLRLALPLIGDTAENAGSALRRLALCDNRIPRTNNANKLLPMILMRLLTGRRAKIDTGVITPRITEPESGFTR